MTGLFFFPYVTSAVGVLLGVYWTNEAREYNRLDYILRACFIFVINIVISFLLEFAFPMETVTSSGIALSTAYFLGLSIYAVVPGLAFGRFTAFRHVGVFPEQLAHWQWMRDVLEARRGGDRPKVLNLFGYTGVASLVAAAAGAEVTHVDASKKAIGWARENQALSGLNDRPIRWICDDAMKFIEREERRGNHYDIILTDPPKFGRGPNGEVWQLFEHLPRMLDLCRAILKPDALGLVLTAYSIRASFYSVHELMMETMRGFGGVVESGELVIREGGLSGTEPGRALSTSLYARWLSQ